MKKVATLRLRRRQLRLSHPESTRTQLRDQSRLNTEIMTSEQDLYHGSCHCGALSFEAQCTGLPTKVYECNCSYCKQTGFQTSLSLPIGDINPVSTWTSYADYQFGKKSRAHRVCSTTLVIDLITTLTTPVLYHMWQFCSHSPWG